MTNSTARVTADPKTRRRTQAERSAATREKILRAVSECIVEEGLAHTTAARIAERSGVTWGAAVHQFGDKDSLILAVLEHSIASYAESLHRSLAGGAETPRARVDLVVDETWRAFNEPSARVFMEIMLNGHWLRDEQQKGLREDVLVSVTRELWHDLFAEFGVDPAIIDTARKLTSATLLGMAIQALLGPRRPRFSREIETLKQSVLTMLGL